MVNNNNLNKFNLKDKKDLDTVIKAVGELYHKCVLIINESSFISSHVDPELVTVAKRNKAKIERCLNLLTDEYKKLIIKIDVIERYERHHYSDLMSKSQYYRYKYLAYYEFKCVLG